MLKLNNYESMLNFGNSKGDFFRKLLRLLNPKLWIESIKTNIEDYKDRKKRKELRRKLKRVVKGAFSVKTMQKIVIGLVTIALIASYILPYVIR